jgi:hypothetical protein
VRYAREHPAAEPLRGPAVLSLRAGRRIIAIMVNAFAILLLPLAAEKPAVPVPVVTDWVPWLLLVLLWILVAAAVIGPVIRYFRAEPRSGQAFSDDRAGH